MFGYVFPRTLLLLKTKASRWTINLKGCYGPAVWKKAAGTFCLQEGQ